MRTEWKVGYANFIFKIEQNNSDNLNESFTLSHLLKIASIKHKQTLLK